MTVVQADLEHAQFAEHAFDLAVAATSWHWVDGAVAVPKVVAALRPGGALALWWTVFGDPDQPHTEFRSVLQPLYERFLPHDHDDGQPPLPMRTDHWSQHLSAEGWFEPPAIEVLRWMQPLTPASAQALWATFPNIAELPHHDRGSFLTGVADAVTAAGGVVEDPRLTIVYHSVARHRGQPHNSAES